MAKISYADYIKKLPTSVLVAEAIFSELYKIYPTDKLSRVCKTTSGGTPLRSRIEFYNGNIPWLKSGELNDGLISNVEEYISELGLKNSSAKLHPKGTLLLAMYGATAGRVGILSLDSSTNQAVCALFPNEDFVSKSFLFWFLRQHRYKFIEISKGGAQPNISQKVINDTLIVLPPLEIQKQIVDVLEFIEKENKLNLDLIPKEFHSRIHSVFTIRDSVENTSSEITHQLDLIKNLRQAFLREAMQGLLVSNKTSDNKTGADLLAEIQAEKAQLVKDKKIKKAKPLVPITEDEIPFDIPENWTWCRLGELSENIVYGTSVKTKDEGEIPVLRMGNITTDGKILLSNLKYTDSTIDDLPALYLKSKDLLFNRTNSFELVGKSAVFNLDEKYTCASYLIIVRFLNIKLSDFICNYINSKLCRVSQLEPNIIQQNGQANFNGTKLSSIIIPLPPLEIQERIVAKLDELMAYCDALEEQVKQSQQTNELLLQQVLREALGA